VRATVLNDPALAKHAGRFAWLSIDGEDARNAAFVEHLSVGGYPTFYVLDGASGDVALRWYGSLTATEFERLLDDGERAVQARGGTPAESALARADRLAAEGKAAEAAAAYKEALGLGPPGWPSRGRAIVSHLAALDKAGELEQCAAVARRDAPALERGPAFAAAAASGLACATGAPEGAAWRAAAIAALEPLVEESLTLGNTLADDRSSAYGALVELRQERGDATAAKATAGRWMDFLDALGTSAASVEERAALDGHRVAAALALGDPARAVGALEASRRDLPEDYNPPARLAILYRELGRYDDALAASEHALGMAYGARKLRIFDARADTYAKMGDPAAARRTLEEALRYAETLPESQRPATFLAHLRKKAEAIGS
jgi:tetratricopeptide (TPR) repeat protein